MPMTMHDVDHTAVILNASRPVKAELEHPEEMQRIRYAAKNAQVDTVAIHFAVAFAATFPNFDKARFYELCGVNA